MDLLLQLVGMGVVATVTGIVALAYLLGHFVGMKKGKEQARYESHSD